jgi:hypothetical protein
MKIVNKESRHCERELRSKRGNPQQRSFLKKYLILELCLVCGLLCRFAPRNDEYAINSVISNI